MRRSTGRAGRLDPAGCHTRRLLHSAGSPPPSRPAVGRSDRTGPAAV
uniref:Uncharacterized protein n=1 Tax=Macrostomum lignano TaxID=282301 RepID=A0A1I8FDH6_9PLAT